MARGSSSRGNCRSSGRRLTGRGLLVMTASVALTALIPACTAGQLSPPTPAPDLVTSNQHHTAALTPEEAIRLSQRVSQIDPAKRLFLTLGLKGRDQQGLSRLLEQGKVITPAQFDARFGPDPALVKGALTTARGAGLDADWSPGSSIISVDGPAALVARLFRVELDDYQLPDGRRFYAANRAPTISASMAPVVTSVLGLENFRRAQRYAVRPGGVTPDDVLGFYNIKSLRDAGLTGAGETVLLLDGTPPNDGDLKAYANAHKLPPFDITVRRDPKWGEDPTTGSRGEATLDVEVIHAIAPSAKIVIYVFDASMSDPSATLSDWVAAGSAEVNEHAGTIMSESLGLCEAVWQGAYSQLEAAYEKAAAIGLTHFVSSGDRGAYECGQDQSPGVPFPGSSPAVTCVGGTTIFASREGLYFREAAWGNPISQAGGGGGLSTLFQRAPWQAGPGVQNSSMRQIPDVAGLADASTGWNIISDGGPEQVGGTSAAAPMWAGIVALINEDLIRRGMRRVGFANPALYSIGQHQGQLTGPPFHDIVLGNNLFYDATPGYDLATGWGTPNVGALASAWENYIEQGGP